jgi:hypothetical protein
VEERKKKQRRERERERETYTSVNALHEMHRPLSSVLVYPPAMR